MDVSDLVHNLRELIELDRGFGVEFVPRARESAAVSPAAAPSALPRSPARPQTMPAAPTSDSRSPAPRVTPPAPAPKPTVSPSPILLAPAPAISGDSLAAIAAEATACTRCTLCSTRTHAVPGEGHPTPQLLFIGEGPGAEEDAQGRPFVGPAGQLLDRMIGAMGLTRAEVFIANVVKCRPPGNRNPEPDEILACLPYLHRQIQVTKPTVICTLGNVPLRALFGADQPGITKVRGQRLSWHGTTVIPTFHPSYLLRNESAKKPCWEDLLVVLRELGREPPVRQK
ncbi:MAG: uracil-DNA glycosylase [Planctomycetes bacterium]|nr:uracil-DNA glycosylase [Planctomycetota bacterium]